MHSIYAHIQYIYILYCMYIIYIYVHMQVSRVVLSRVSRAPWIGRGYLLSCPETSEAVLIDPVLEQKERDLKVPWSWRSSMVRMNTKDLKGEDDDADHVCQITW